MCIYTANNQGVFWSLLHVAEAHITFLDPSSGILNHSNDAQRRRNSRKRRYPGRDVWTSMCIWMYTMNVCMYINKYI